MRSTLLLYLAAGLACAATPEIERPPVSPQTAGTPHTLRLVPEACLRIDGVFAASGYQVTLHPRPGCQPRARFEPVAGIAAPGGEGWILNDVLRVPRADRPECVATISVWRHPGALAPIEQDGQQRVRLYLDEKQAPAEKPRFAATLSTSEACN